MKVIAFLGSPRKGGNTEILLNEAVKGMGMECEVFDLSRLKIAPCLHCGDCEATGRCSIADDMDAAASAIREAHRVILAAPVYFSGVPAQAKALIDRCQQFWCEKYLLKMPLPGGPYGRKGLVLTVGGRKEEAGIKCVEATATAFFRSISVSEHITVGFTGIDAKGEILNHPSAMMDAFEAGRRLAIT